MSRKTWFTVGWFIVAASWGFILWVGANVGFAAGSLTMFAMIPVTGWIFHKVLPQTALETDAEKKANEMAWAGFFEKLYWPVGPIALGIWLFLMWSRGL